MYSNGLLKALERNLAHYIGINVKWRMANILIFNENFSIKLLTSE